MGSLEVYSAEGSIWLNSTFATSTSDNFKFDNGTTSPNEKNVLFDIASGIVDFRKFFICPVGVLVNVICVIVLLKGDLRKMMLLPYLIALAIVDGSYLFVDLLNEIVGRMTIVTGGYCKFSMYAALTAGAYSDLLIVAMAVHRLIAVCLPLKANMIVTFKTTLTVTISLLIIVSLLYCTSLVSYGLYDGHIWCLSLPEYDHLLEYEVILGLVKTVFCSTVILTVTIAIVYKLHLNRRNIAAARSSSNTESHVTMMLLCTTTLFLFTNLPLAIFIFFQSFTVIDPDVDFFMMALLLTLKAFGLFLDFFLYFMASSIFRAEVKRLFGCFSKKDFKFFSGFSMHRNSNTQDQILSDTVETSNL